MGFPFGRDAREMIAWLSSTSCKRQTPSNSIIRRWTHKVWTRVIYNSEWRWICNYKHREETLLFYRKTIGTNYHSKYHELSHTWKLMKHERYGQKLTPSVSSQQPPSYRKSHRSSWAPRICGGSWWCMALNNNLISIYEYAFYAERTFILQWCLTLRSWLLAEKGSNLI